jgi:hypothetical protein
MKSTAVPLLLAALLAGGGGGAATWALASNDTSTGQGNEAPIDDNHRQTAPPATASAAPRPAAPRSATVTTPQVTRTPRGTVTRTPEPGDDRGAAQEPEPGDDRGGSSEPEPGDDRGHDGSGRDRGTDDGSGHT